MYGSAHIARSLTVDLGRYPPSINGGTLPGTCRRRDVSKAVPGQVDFLAIIFRNLVTVARLPIATGFFFGRLSDIPG